MKWIKYVLLSLLAVYFLIGVKNWISNRPSEKERLVKIILHDVAKKVGDEKGLTPFGKGGTMMYEIKDLMLAFISYRPVEITEARELLVYVVQEFLNRVNSNEKIQPYLCQYPFGVENVEILIECRKEDGQDVEKGKLSFSVAQNGIFTYKAWDADAKKFIPLHKETYSEALMAMQEARKQAVNE